MQRTRAKSGSDTVLKVEAEIGIKGIARAEHRRKGTAEDGVPPLRQDTDRDFGVQRMHMEYAHERHL